MPSSPTETPASARAALLTMWTIRRFEEAVDDLFARGLMHGTMHLSIGQEAVSVGVCEALRPDDVAFGSYRGHALYLAKGGCLKAMIAELFGRADGCGLASKRAVVAPKHFRVGNYRLYVNPGRKLKKSSALAYGFRLFTRTF